MRCADLQALGVFPQDLLPDNLMVNTCVWCSEELSCETQQQLSLCLFWIICPPKTTVLMFYLSVKLYFSKYVLAANWGLTGLSSLLLSPVFPVTLFILDCAGSESQTDRQVRSRREPDYGKAWESQGMACCRLYTWLFQMAMEMAWPDASY